MPPTSPFRLSHLKDRTMFVVIGWCTGTSSFCAKSETYGRMATSTAFEYCAVICTSGVISGQLFHTAFGRYGQCSSSIRPIPLLVVLADAEKLIAIQLQIPAVFPIGADVWIAIDGVADRIGNVVAVIPSKFEVIQEVSHRFGNLVVVCAPGDRIIEAAALGVVDFGGVSEKRPRAQPSFLEIAQGKRFVVWDAESLGPSAIGGETGVKKDEAVILLHVYRNLVRTEIPGNDVGKAMAAVIKITAVYVCEKRAQGVLVGKHHTDVYMRCTGIRIRKSERESLAVIRLAGWWRKEGVCATELRADATHVVNGLVVGVAVGHVAEIVLIRNDPGTLGWERRPLLFGRGFLARRRVAATWSNGDIG